jgi:rRNA maturation RNase YbeY
MTEERWLSILRRMLSVGWLSMDLFEFNRDAVEIWLSKVVLNEGFEFGELALVFCTDDELLDINIKHLSHDYYTDIITFDYSSEKIVSGDLFISVDRVRENALVFSEVFQSELYRVIVHGVLHLIGFSDKSEKESELMRCKEDYYLNKL